MTYDICYQKCPFFRRVEDPKIRRKKVSQKSGTRLSVQGVIDFCSEVNSAAVSLWLSRHLDSHGSERLGQSVNRILVCFHRMDGCWQVQLTWSASVIPCACWPSADQWVGELWRVFQWCAALRTQRVWLPLSFRKRAGTSSLVVAISERSQSILVRAALAGCSNPCFHRSTEVVKLRCVLQARSPSAASASAGCVQSNWGSNCVRKTSQLGSR